MMQLFAKSRYLFSQKTPILRLCQGPKHASSKCVSDDDSRGVVVKNPANT